MPSKNRRPSESPVFYQGVNAIAGTVGGHISHRGGCTDKYVLIRADYPLTAKSLHDAQPIQLPKTRRGSSPFGYDRVGSPGLLLNGCIRDFKPNIENLLKVCNDTLSRLL